LGPLSPDRLEELVPGRVVDNAEEGRARLLEGEGDAKDGEGMGEIRGPVQGIEDPAEIGRPLAQQAFFGEEAVVRECNRKAPEDHVLRQPVEAGHEIDGPLVHDLAPLAVALPENTTGLAGGGFRGLEKGFDRVHGPISYQLAKAVAISPCRDPAPGGRHHKNFSQGGP
jgi:hypothetical protein